jgi:hypothetical protein
MRNTDSLDSRSLPKKVAEAPKPMNMMENPNMKRRELTITRLDIRFLPLSFLNSSSDKPDMKEIYIGISGSMHGDTNETSPATKAAKKDTLSNLSSLPSLPEFV